MVLYSNKEVLGVKVVFQFAAGIDMDKIEKKNPEQAKLVSKILISISCKESPLEAVCHLINTFSSFNGELVFQSTYLRGDGTVIKNKVYDQDLKELTEINLESYLKKYKLEQK